MTILALDSINYMYGLEPRKGIEEQNHRYGICTTKKVTNEGQANKKSKNKPNLTISPR